jgi:polar amino acid transport system substrate-binding protein/cystine transport system substrate-binding protein
MLRAIGRIGWFNLVLSVALAGPAAASYKDKLLKPDTIVVGTTGSAPPATMTDAQGQLEGYDIDLAQKLGKDLGLKVELVQLDWAGLLPGLAAGRFDVVASGVTRTAQRLASKDLILLSPDLINGVAITKRRGDDAIKGWADVCGKRMGAVRGAIEPKDILATLPKGCVTDTRDYPGWTELALDLKNRRIDWIGMDFLGPVYAAKQDPALEVIPDVRKANTQGLAISPKEPELAAAMDALVKKYREDGTLDVLIEKWFGTKVDWSKI